jgi:putative transposase
MLVGNALRFMWEGQARVMRSVMEALKRFSGRCPQRIQMDNGSEFISKAMDRWACENDVVLDFFRPGKPTDNALIESFNGSFTDACLNTHWFLSLDDAREKSKHGVVPTTTFGRIRPLAI